MNYSHVLSEFEISALKNGVSFGFVRPEKLIFFYIDKDLPQHRKTFFQYTSAIKFLAIMNMKNYFLLKNLRLGGFSILGIKV